jgi:hypothetical protein
MTCETTIGQGWQSFVDVGLALAQTRDERRYKAEYESFESYCQIKWQYGRNYVDRLISAAQVFRYLVTNIVIKISLSTKLRSVRSSGLPRSRRNWPGREPWKWPLAGISPPPGQSALHELKLAAKPPPKRSSRPNKAQQQKAINGAMGEILLLLSQKASHDVLTEKFEALHLQIQGLFPKATAKT